MIDVDATVPTPLQQLPASPMAFMWAGSDVVIENLARPLHMSYARSEGVVVLHCQANVALLINK